MGVAALCLSGPASATTEFQDMPYLQARVGQVLEITPDGGEGDWFNEATGNSGRIRVLQTLAPGPDGPCRDYERTTRRHGQSDAVVRGTGCRDASGRWRLKEAEKGGPAAPESAGTAGGQAGGKTGGQAGGQTGSQIGGQGSQQGGAQGGQSGGSATPDWQATAQPQTLLPPAEPEAPAPAATAAPAPTARAPTPSPADDLSIDMPTPSE